MILTGVVADFVLSLFVLGCLTLLLMVNWRPRWSALVQANLMNVGSTLAGDQAFFHL